MSRWTRIPLSFFAFLVMFALSTWVLFEIMSVINDFMMAVRSS